MVVSHSDWAAAKEEVSKKNKRDELIKGASVKIKVNRASHLFEASLDYMRIKFCQDATLTQQCKL
jgi:hypothetical protein